MSDRADIGLRSNGGAHRSDPGEALENSQTRLPNVEGSGALRRIGGVSEQAH